MKSRMCVAALKQKKRQGKIPCKLSGTAEFIRLIFFKVRRFFIFGVALTTVDSGTQNVSFGADGYPQGIPDY